MESPSKTERALKALAPWLERHKRPAWLPETREGDAPPTASKFAGTPWLADGEKWPVCENCGSPLRFFLQLDLATLPTELAGRFGDGLLQLFYCTNRRADCEYVRNGWDAFSPGTLVRITPVDQSGCEVMVPDLLMQEPSPKPTPVSNPFLDNHAGQAMSDYPDLGYAFPPKEIVRWIEVEDVPGPSDHVGLGITYRRNDETRTSTLECQELGVVIDGLDYWHFCPELGEAKRGDKLAGWPAWIQYAEYPNCPKCQGRMQFVFQIASDRNLPYHFGDMGTGYLMQCSQHKDVLAFLWQCF